MIPEKPRVPRPHGHPRSRAAVGAPVLRGPGGLARLTPRQAQVLELTVKGLSGRQIAHRLGISTRTVEDRFRELRQRTGTRSRAEMAAYAVASGLVTPPLSWPATDGETGVRIGYARVPAQGQDAQEQLSALEAAGCREVVVEAAGSRDASPGLRRVLDMLGRGDTLVIHTPDRIARSVGELFDLLLNDLHARGVSLHILSGVCAGLHQPDGATLADKMLFQVAAMAVEMERDLTRERTGRPVTPGR